MELRQPVQGQPRTLRRQRNHLLIEGPYGNFLRETRERGPW